MTLIWQHDIVVADVQMYHALGVDIVKSLQQLPEYGPADLFYTSDLILLPVCQYIMFLLLSVDLFFHPIYCKCKKVCSSLWVWMLCLPDKWEGPAPDRVQPQAHPLPHPHSNPDRGEVRVMVFSEVDTWNEGTDGMLSLLNVSASLLPNFLCVSFLKFWCFATNNSPDCLLLTRYTEL